MVMQKNIGGAIASKSDNMGNYGRSGKRCDEITADLIANWYPTQIQAASYVPDVIVLTGVIVNDVWSTPASNAVIKARLDDLIRTLRIWFPAVKIVITTPHPRRDSGPMASAAYAKAYAYARSYINSLDDGATIKAVDLGCASYMNADGMTPFPQYFYGATQGNLSNMTDDPGVHPNVTACSINGRLIAEAIKSMMGFAVPGGFITKSKNLLLTGSVALTGTGNSGTVPTSLTQVTGLGTGSSCVGVAANPGPYRVTLKAGRETPTGIAEVQNGAFTLRFQQSTTNMPPANTQVGTFHKVTIVSGAENLAQISGQITVAGGTTPIGTITNFNASQYERPGVYVNGDVLWLVTPLGLVNVGTPTAPTDVYHDIFVRLWKPNAELVLEISQQSWAEWA
jgi:hypothetical protein